MASFPPPNVQAALSNPTLQTTDPNSGYVFDTTSPIWKAACAALPSFAALCWPGYATACVPATIDGVDVVIQPWMGNCEQLFGRSNFPGGIGGEVGVYVRVPGGKPLPDLSVLPGPVQLMFRAAAVLGGDNLWWADANVQPEIDFTIINPVNSSVLLQAGPETNYWVNKWMEPSSYARYVAAQGGQVPSSATDYKMVYTVAGVTREWTGAGQ
jgi:hypothetical protein